MGGLASALIIGGAAVGASALLSNKLMGAQQKDASGLLDYQPDQSVLAGIPQVPQPPTGNAADAATNEAEAERKRQLAAIEDQDRQNMVNPTGALGDTSRANVGTKNALGT